MKRVNVLLEMMRSREMQAIDWMVHTFIPKET